MVWSGGGFFPAVQRTPRASAPRLQPVLTVYRGGVFSLLYVFIIVLSAPSRPRPGRGLAAKENSGVQ
jgi:hypothetical protein